MNPRERKLNEGFTYVSKMEEEELHKPAFKIVSIQKLEDYKKKKKSKKD